MEALSKLGKVYFSILETKKLNAGLYCLELKLKEFFLEKILFKRRLLFSFTGTIFVLNNTKLVFSGLVHYVLYSGICVNDSSPPASYLIIRHRSSH